MGVHFLIKNDTPTPSPCVIPVLIITGFRFPLIAIAVGAVVILIWCIEGAVKSKD